MYGMCSICRAGRREARDDQGHARRDEKAFSECFLWKPVQVVVLSGGCLPIHPKQLYTYSCSVLRLSTRLSEAPTNTSEACNSRDEAALDRDTRGQKCLRESRLKGLAKRPCPPTRSNVDSFPFLQPPQRFFTILFPLSSSFSLFPMKITRLWLERMKFNGEFLGRREQRFSVYKNLFYIWVFFLLLLRYLLFLIILR